MQFFKSALVTAVALCAALAVQARTLDEVKKDGKIIVATEGQFAPFNYFAVSYTCLLYTSPSPRDVEESRMPSSA